MRTDVRHRISPQATSQAAATVAASILILLGIVFQLGELGCSHLNATNLWLLHMMAENVWTLLATRFNLPALADVLSYWPLLLVGVGFGILALTKTLSRRSRSLD
jgi:hypothetical protein